VVEAASAEESGSEAAAAEAAPSRPGSLLPRRNQQPTPVKPQPPAAVSVPQAAAAPSLLPKKARPAGRAEQRRRQEANLEPMDESPAVPMDRTPYLRLDIGRVVLTSTVMLVLVILGWLFIH
jgi:hypothetical protein